MLTVNPLALPKCDGIAGQRERRAAAVEARFSRIAGAGCSQEAGGAKSREAAGHAATGSRARDIVGADSAGGFHRVIPAHFCS